MAYTRCSVNRANAATEPEMSAITKISGLCGPRVAELRLGRHAAVAERVAHGAAEVERALAPVAALAGQAHGELAG